MTYSAPDFLAQFQQLLPQGRIWPREPDALLTQTIATLMPTYARLAGRDANLLIDAFPATTDELLPEWEATLGLPDPCAGPQPTLQQRQAQVLARFTAFGGQSVPYYTNYAAALGFPVTIAENAPAIAGKLAAGQPLNGLAWAFAWYVDAPPTNTTNFRAGASSAGEPLTAFGDAVLTCEMERLAPAHTNVTARYRTPASNVAVWDGFRWDDGHVWA